MRRQQPLNVGSSNTSENGLATRWLSFGCDDFAWLPGVGAGAGADAGAGAERSRPRSALGDDGDSNDKLCRCLRIWLQLLSAFN